MLNNVNVSRAIADAQAKLAKKYEITVDKIVSELAKIGFSNMADYMKTTSSCYPYLDCSELLRDQLVALTGERQDHLLHVGLDHLSRLRPLQYAAPLPERF